VVNIAEKTIKFLVESKTIFLSNKSKTFDL